MGVVAVDEFFLSVRHFCIPSRTLALKGASALVVLPVGSQRASDGIDKRLTKMPYTLLK